MTVGAPGADLAVEPWWTRLPHAEGHTLVAVLSAEFPPGAVVDLPDGLRPPGWRIAVRVATGRVRAVEVAASRAPLLWYVELPEPQARPAATTLVAFSDPRYADGTVLAEGEARAAAVSAGDQVAAVRWWPETGLVHQVYVAPAARRLGVGSTLVQAAFGVQAARGLPTLHGDGRRTELGEQWRERLPEEIAVRMAPWSERMAPMTPGG